MFHYGMESYRCSVALSLGGNSGETMGHGTVGESGLVDLFPLCPRQRPAAGTIVLHVPLVCHRQFPLLDDHGAWDMASCKISGCLLPRRIVSPPGSCRPRVTSHADAVFELKPSFSQCRPAVHPETPTHPNATCLRTCSIKMQCVIASSNKTRE